MRPRSSSVPAFALAALLAACGGADDPPVDPINGDTWAFPANGVTELDVLFVIDNSGSMAGEQASLAANFPLFLSTLTQTLGALPGLHLGIVSSNVGAAGQANVPGCAGQGDDGNLQVKAGCSGVTGTFLEDVPDGVGGRRRNYTGSLDQIFACMAQLGTGGCGFEQHLESMFRALQPGKNAGFLRRDAALAVVILADEDDCSTEMGVLFGDPTAGLSSPLGPRTSYRCFEFGVTCDNDPNPRAFGTRTGCRSKPDSQYMFEVSRYIDFLRSLKTDPALVSVIGIFGKADEQGTVVVGADPYTPANPMVQKSCFLIDPNDPNDGAAPAIRLGEVVRAFPGHSLEASICQGSLADAAVSLAETVQGTLGTMCLPQRLRDTVPATICNHATRIDCDEQCRVVDVLDRTLPTRRETAVPSCDESGGAKPCWRISESRTRCATSPDQLELNIERAAPAPAGTFVEIRCAVE